MNMDEIIAQRLNIADAPAEIQQEMIADVHTIIESRLVLLMDELLTDDQRKEFYAVRDEQGDAEARRWIDNNVTNIQELYASLLNDYLAEKAQ